MILCLVKTIKGDCSISGFKNYFSLTSFSFNVERELKDSNKAGTADINIGVAEMQECSMGKSMDSASVDLAKRAISGSSVGTAEIKFVETVDNKNVVYLAFKMDNAFIKSWSISGDADDRPTEEITLWYNKIAFVYYPTKDGKSFGPSHNCAWDATMGAPWSGHALPASIETHAS